jgi:hypothetical protein
MSDKLNEEEKEKEKKNKLYALLATNLSDHPQ